MERKDPREKPARRLTFSAHLRTNGECELQKRQPALISPAQANDRFDPPVTALAWPSKNAARVPSTNARAPNRARRDTVLAVVSATCINSQTSVSTNSFATIRVFTTSVQ